MATVEKTTLVRLLREREAVVSRHHKWKERSPLTLEGQAADKIEALTDALGKAREKLTYYRQQHSGEYVGGTEYVALIGVIDAAMKL